MEAVGGLTVALQLVNAVLAEPQDLKQRRGLFGTRNLAAGVNMLRTVSPEPDSLFQAEFVPEFLRPLSAGLKWEDGASDVVASIVRQLGFTSLLYGASASPTLDHESRSYVFTTLPSQWVARYDQCAYIEVDRRLHRALASSVPVVWDYAGEYGRDERADQFFKDSLAHGVGSGVVVGMHGPRNIRVIVALSTGAPCIDARMRDVISEDLGRIVLFAIYFHEIFMRSVVERGVAPASQGVPLSSREHECLTFAAHGQTSRDIAQKLGISERTIQFHFDSIRSKLGALNRQEAVAKAIASGIIRA